MAGAPYTAVPELLAGQVGGRASAHIRLCQLCLLCASCAGCAGCCSLAGWAGCPIWAAGVRPRGRVCVRALAGFGGTGARDVRVWGGEGGGLCASVQCACACRFGLAGLGLADARWGWLGSVAHARAQAG